MLVENERKQIVEFCQKMITSGLTKGTGGNISVYDRKSKLVAISSSGQDYFEMSKSDVCVMDLDGKVIEGDKKPSSEYQMHLLIYKNFPKARAVVHCHSVYATALSILREELPASNYLVASGGGNNIRCAKYASFGSLEIGEEAVKAMKDRKGCLLANHGQICYGESLEKAFSLASTIEECSMTYMIARSVGKPVILDKEEMDFMVEKFKSYGR